MPGSAAAADSIPYQIVSEIAEVGNAQDRIVKTKNKKEYQICKRF